MAPLSTTRNQQPQPGAPASPASSETSLEEHGCLEANVLSVYDLPYPDVIPKAVTLSVRGMFVSSGPPLARQKDRNSFRFAPVMPDKTKTQGGSNSIGASKAKTSAASAAPIKLVAPLRELYQETLKIRVVYEDPEKCLETELDLRQLHIHEQKWLILNLAPTPRPGTTHGSSNNGSNGNANTSESAIVKSTATIPSVAEEDMSPPPTIRIKFKLSGPYRPEIAALVNLARTWFGVVDAIEGKISRSSSAMGNSLPNIGINFNKNLLLVPAAPFLAVVVAAVPLLAGVAALALPFLLPIVLVCAGLLATVALSGGLLYSSTSTGRSKLGSLLTPLVETLVVSRPGQALVYDTGPRPTPVSVCRQIMPDTMWAKLWISLLIDAIGSSSYLLPLAGEGLDLAWAPAQTVLIMAMYESTSPNLKYLSFIEEALPFTDIVPSACIGWACEFLPKLWKDHAERTNTHVDPEVTRAVTQLVTTAANVVRTRNSRSSNPTAVPPATATSVY
ncbi:unnamed protein product [Pseudo-nitzschia multistriata]|uniref:Uncharacterized protein n=1 Tax=Pseudo-nitzschia multistriata TaxID=183589 RepID=A0A448Z135_9STRA|nr:unnamed protein product [Pseudo-nitzschia multistriata]